ncbi:hypothetical protein ON010_g11960 [Phytophthora cinnamomi]|nr:hypothetical protein ON010_g11960 [Phytophthora cinnamomi]
MDRVRGHDCVPPEPHADAASYRDVPDGLARRRGFRETGFVDEEDQVHLPLVAHGAAPSSRMAVDQHAAERVLPRSALHLGASEPCTPAGRLPVHERVPGDHFRDRDAPAVVGVDVVGVERAALLGQDQLLGLPHAHVHHREPEDLRPGELLRPVLLEVAPHPGTFDGDVLPDRVPVAIAGAAYLAHPRREGEARARCSAQVLEPQPESTLSDLP